MVGHRGLEPRPVGLQPTALPVKLTAQVCHLNGGWRAKTYLRQQISQDFLGNRSLIIAVIRISSPKIILHSAPNCNQAIAPSVDLNHSYFMPSLSEGYTNGHTHNFRSTSASLEQFYLTYYQGWFRRGGSNSRRLAYETSVNTDSHLDTDIKN